MRFIAILLAAAVTVGCGGWAEVRYTERQTETPASTPTQSTPTQSAPTLTVTTSEARGSGLSEECERVEAQAENIEDIGRDIKEIRVALDYLQRGEELWTMIGTQKLRTFLPEAVQEDGTVDREKATAAVERRVLIMANLTPRIEACKEEAKARMAAEKEAILKELEKK